MKERFLLKMTLIFLFLLIVITSCTGILNNKLVNTSWQEVGGRGTIIFGKNSYTFTNFLGKTSSGAYKVSGDTVTITVNAGIFGEMEYKGSLINENLTLMGIRFQRKK